MGASQLNKNPASTLLRTAVKEIGLRSESIDWGRGTFPKFRTSSYFHREGTHRSLIDELKIGGLYVVQSSSAISSGFRRDQLTCALESKTKKNQRLQD